jgi:hypothetical protein
VSANFISGSLIAQGLDGTKQIKLTGGVNIVAAGVFVGTLGADCSFDGGATWVAVSKDATGAPLGITAPGVVTLWQPEADVLYRARCTAFTSGPLAYRISGNG